ncbi:MAG: FkbM family methyltransferase [Clostridia bacterium]
MELICENQSLWDYLRETDKNIYLYGLGLGTEKILKVCENRGIVVKNVLISDKQRKIRAEYTEKYDILKISKALEDPKAIILLGFGTQKEEVLEYFYYLDDNFEVYAPDVPVFGDGVFDLDYFNENRQNFERAYSLLADDISRETFKATLNYKISGKVKYLRNFTQHKDEMFKKVLKIHQNEHYVDLGAYTGDTIREVMQYGGYETVTAFEPDVKNYTKMQTFIETEQLSNINALNIGVWSDEDVLKFAGKSSRNSSLMQSFENVVEVPVNSVDNIMGDKPVTLIKMDVEGAERQAIEGARNTIKHNKPRLNIAIYHRNEDLFDIIFRLYEICPEYKFYVRHHEYIPSWDTNLYATI